MIPIRSMDSYPYQRNQMPFPQYYHPGIEALPPPMKVDPSKPHLSYDPRWPYAANYGHLIPPHFCCGHNNFPCHYGYMPSYPHAPSSMHYSGGCPAYTDPYFLPYSPQPHQTMELPRYDYDKHMPRDHHCCGCPNHSCNQKEGTSVKIEEHEPDVGRKVNDSLVPIQLKNYPYPFVWIPPEHTSNKQLNNPNTMEVGEKNKPPSVENANAVAQPAQEPRVWNGWLPFDIKGVPSTIHDGFEIRNQKQDSGNNGGESENGEMDQKRQSEPKRSEFPFPIFWLPYYNKLEESGETNNQEKNNSSPKIVEEVPHVVKSVPVKSHVDEGGMNRTRSDQAARPDTNASDVAEKVTNARSIPVKQIGKDASLDQMEENVAKKDSSTDDKRGQSASLPKASKLPPVCLRVDPLPRKKNGNGSSRSRSLSPPSSKGQAQVTSGETLKTPVSGTNDKTQQNLNNQNAPGTTEKVEPKEKTIQEYECKTNENKGVDKTDECQSQINVNIPSEGSKRTKDTCTDSDECKIEDKEAGKGAENMEETTQLGEVKDSSTLTDVGSKEGKILSDSDAAVLIQAAYRGYQVRKWELLKKLKQIDEVRKEVTNVQDRVQAFERSSDLQNDEKQKISIGENIMRLLLKLDTIQGLHPNLREIRKSLARVLTMLQERLDSLMANKPQQQMQAIQKDVEVTPTNMQNEEKLALPGDSSEGNSDGGNVSQSPFDPVPNEGGESVKNGSWSEDTIQVVTADTLNSTCDLSETDKMAVESEDKSESKDILIEVDELDMTVVKELPVGVLDEDSNDASIEKEEEHDNTGSGSVSAMVNDSARDGLGSENHAMMELPVELLDDEDERDNEMNISKETQTKNGEFIEELPVGLLDEKAEESEEEKHDEANPKEVLMAQERECNADEETSSSTDDTSKEAQSEKQQQPLEAQKEDIELPPLTTNANDHEAGNEDVCLEANDANNISVEPTEFVTIEDTQKEEEPEEKIALKETPKDGEEKVAETLAEEKAVSAALQADHDGGLNGESKLVEENEKLREMMKKLLEAGNEQLSVISDLSGRVKELEKRLARSRNKRMKTKRYRSAASKISGMSS